jgi:hypothetical protein
MTHDRTRAYTSACPGRVDGLGAVGDAFVLVAVDTAVCGYH